MLTNFTVYGSVIAILDCLFSVIAKSTVDLKCL